MHADGTHQRPQPSAMQPIWMEVKGSKMLGRGALPCRIVVCSVAAIPPGGANDP